MHHFLDNRHGILLGYMYNNKIEILLCTGDYNICVCYCACAGVRAGVQVGTLVYVSVRTRVRVDVCADTCACVRTFRRATGARMLMC